MAEPGTIGQRVEQIAISVTEAAGIEFVHSEIAGSKRSPVVRLIIDKPGGVTLEDCAQVSRDVETILDRDDFIPTAYVLEVSSPGIERELYELADFVRFTGKDARVKTNRPIEGQRNFSGTIVGVKENEIEIEDRTNGRVRIPHESVVKANLMVDVTEDLRKH